jgi:hypothetical protein
MKTPKTLTAGMTVNYVAPKKTEDGKVSIVKGAKIIAVEGEDSARIDIKGDGNHIALAAYSEDHTQENTFHFDKKDEAPAASANGQSPK